ncbi:phage baseplate assembly protein V [Roseomonas chloroacetimidivorans]|uniref:phage baseplate assembly protein V n=1 Tax=Roseomonas chloroacetimidivorans TaxID=1766656 RepID=UPI003C77A1D8
MLQDAMRREATRAGRQFMPTRHGTVDGVDPDAHAVRVLLQPDGVLTGWLPVETISIGPTWKLHWLPEVGAQVKVEFQEGGKEAGVVTGALYDQAHPAPEGVPTGGVWLVHENARLKLNPDGSIDVLSAAVRIGAMGASFRRLVIDTFQALFDTHSHPGNGQPPTQKMQASHFTTNLTGS